ncbi:MAG: desulfoferrodoxin [Bacteroidales bacterium]|nr:desulfoferrodoxin [Bacteroidales bacterium]
MKTKFFYCKHCGNVVIKLVDSGVVPVCCGEEMVELKSNTMDNVAEKHLPVVKAIDQCNYCVKVGADLHPMEKQHHIAFIAMETEHGIQVGYLDEGSPAIREFCNCGDKIRAVYSYCNVHGLWANDCRKGCGTEKKGCETEKKSCETEKKSCGSGGMKTD